MLVRNKYVLFALGGVMLLSISVILDVHRQQILAENYAFDGINRVVSTGTALREWGLPDTLLNIDIKRIDTNYTFSQWEVIFAAGDNGFIQVFVKPSNVVGIPILNFENDFSIDYVAYEATDHDPLTAHE